MLSVTIRSEIKKLFLSNLALLNRIYIVIICLYLTDTFKKTIQYPKYTDRLLFYNIVQ